MALRTGCIYSKPSEADGMRICVMNRTTLNDGVTPDPLIYLGITHDLSWPALAPKDRLLGDYYLRNGTWEELEEAFKVQLATLEMHKELWALITLASFANVTILCKEETPEHCHRRLVAEAVKKMAPYLEVIIE